jgi:uncharacterized 2Fe-2S/4Fe-4S cluster protein (DUF4445 family)
MPSIELLPGGKLLEAADGTSLRDILFSEGVEFPCGGLGRCRRCKVRVLRGHWPVSLTDWRLLSVDEIRDGWRLSCQGSIQSNLALEIAQWESAILADDTKFDFTPAEGLGIAVDLGTTTTAAQLVDLQTARILAVTTALNAQGAHGGDVMTRLDFALNGGAAKLTQIIRDQIHNIIKTLLSNANRLMSEVRSIVLVGNTAMHHLFCGLLIDQLARDPFEPFSLEQQRFTASELNWDRSEVPITFLPPIGGFVGSDILAGIIATRLHQHPNTVALMDLGTNGEVVVAHRGQIVCASTAAGPAFEGARITSGMRAATGAIHAVRRHGDLIHFDVMGGGKPRGICGSGLVDAISTGLDVEIINANGRFANGAPHWPLLNPIALHQKDVRELQLAKGAIAAGLMILLNEANASIDALDQVFLAGAFGNYVNRESACRIGLIPVSSDKVIQAGNTALLGAKLALFPEYSGEFDSLQRRVRHVPLNERGDFQEIFIEQMLFPTIDRADSQLTMTP